MIKKEVEIDAHFDESGFCTPKCLYFDQKPYLIDKVSQIKKIASSVYYTDVRYTIVINNKTRYLYRYKDMWYVEIEN